MEKQTMPYVIIRTYSAGVHMGYLKAEERVDGHYAVELVNSRRIWSWAGANTLSDLAIKGSKKPSECKVTSPVPYIKLMAIEIVGTTATGQQALESIPEWTFEN
jgi:hypothetical protein